MQLSNSTSAVALGRGLTPLLCQQRLLETRMMCGRGMMQVIPGCNWLVFSIGYTPCVDSSRLCPAQDLRNVLPTTDAGEAWKPDWETFGEPKLPKLPLSPRYGSEDSSWYARWLAEAFIRSARPSRGAGLRSRASRVVVSSSHSGNNSSSSSRRRSSSSSSSSSSSGSSS